RHHQSGLPEHLETLHHPEPGHLQAPLQLGERAAVSLVAQIEQGPTGRLGQSLADQVLIPHGSTICDQIVTCQRVFRCRRSLGRFTETPVTTSTRPRLTSRVIVSPANTADEATPMAGTPIMVRLAETGSTLRKITVWAHKATPD